MERTSAVSITTPIRKIHVPTKAFEDKLKKLNDGSLPDAGKLDANLVKKINDYGRLACGGGPVSIQDPSPLPIRPNYYSRSVSGPVLYGQDYYNGAVSRFKSFNGSCAKQTDGRFLCGGYAYYTEQQMALLQNNTPENAAAYLAAANVNLSDGSKSAMSDAAEKYGTRNQPGSDLADQKIIEADATATYNSDVISKNGTVVHHRGDLKFPEIQESEKLATNGANQANETFFANFDPKKTTGAFLYCPSPTVVKPLAQNWVDPIELHEPCDISVGGNFKDNNWSSTTSLKMDQDLKTAAATNKCVSDAKKLGYAVSSINIKASSSSLNNTDLAAQKCCKKDFQCLSQARADATKEKLPGLMQGLGFGMPPDADVHTSDTKGLNGDGTTGACAYIGSMGADGKFHEQRSTASAATLNAEKFVTLTVTFKKPNTPLPKQLTRTTTVRCYRVVFGCQ